jgi:hypothetical protein
VFMGWSSLIVHLDFVHPPFSTFYTPLELLIFHSNSESRRAKAQRVKEPKGAELVRLHGRIMLCWLLV